MNLGINMALSGHGSLKTYRLVDGVRVDEQERGVFKNIITDYGIGGTAAYFGTVAPRLTNISIGDGASHPQYINTTLGHYLRYMGTTRVSTEYTNVTSAGRTATSLYQATFDPTGSGYSVTELGFSANQGYSNLCTHALVRDKDTGKAISLAIASDEYLEISYVYIKTLAFPPTQPVTVSGLDGVPAITKMELFEGNANLSTGTSLYVPEISYATEDAPNTFISFGSVSSPESGVDTSGGSLVKYTDGRIAPPLPNDRSIKKIRCSASMGGASGEYPTLLFTFADELLWPADHELTINLTFSITRDPEPEIDN